MNPRVSGSSAAVTATTATPTLGYQPVAKVADSAWPRRGRTP